MTDVGTTKRKAMTPSRRLKLFEAHLGKCCLCGEKIDGVHEKWTIEHLVALGLSGADDDRNCAPAHEDCRREKDKDDVSRIAKAKRVKQRHIGIQSQTAKIASAGFPLSSKALKRQQNPKTQPARRPLYASAAEVQE